MNELRELSPPPCMANAVIKITLYKDTTAGAHQTRYLPKYQRKEGAAWGSHPGGLSSKPKISKPLPKGMAGGTDVVREFVPRLYYPCNREFT